MVKEQQKMELIIMRKGRTIYAKLSNDKDFPSEEVEGALIFKAEVESVDQAKEELRDLAQAGNFKAVVPSISPLAPEHAQLVLFYESSNVNVAKTAEGKRHRRTKDEAMEGKAFKVFVEEWKAKNNVLRMPKAEQEELRQGDWQELKDKFIANWAKGQEPAKAPGRKKKGA